MAKSLTSSTAGSAQVSDAVVKQTYIGLCHSFGTFARIEPLWTIVRTGSSAILNRNLDLTEFGPSEKVFWPQQQGYPSNHDSYDDMLVEFRIEPNIRHSDTGDTNRDRFQVAKKGRSWSLDYAGSRIITLDLNKADLSLRGSKLTPKVWIRWNKRLHGPWKVKELPGLDSVQIEPSIPSCVYSYPEPGRDKVVAAGGLEYVIEELSSDGRQVHDRSTPAQLLNFFLKEALPRLTWDEVRDAQKSPSKDKLRAFFDSFADPDKRELAIQRLDRVQSVLDAAELSAEMLEDVISSTAFKSLLEKALAREVQSRSMEFGAKAHRTIESGLSELEELVRLEQSQLEPIRQERAQLIREKERLEKDVDRLRQQADRTKDAQRVLDAARAAFERKKNDVLGEFWAIESLLKERSVPGSAQPQPAHRPAPKNPVTRRDFLLALKTLSNDPAQQAATDSLTYALTACRWTMVSRLSDVAAFARASDSELVVVQCDPRWITFEDFYQGDARHFWTEAQADSSRLYILVIEQLEQSLHNAWLNPILHTISGLQSSPRRHVPWPTNLRLATPASSEVPTEVIPFVAAVATPGGFVPVRGPVAPMASEAWRFGSDESELTRLKRFMVEDGVDAAKAQARADRIRVTWPQDLRRGEAAR